MVWWLNKYTHVNTTYNTDVLPLKKGKVYKLASKLTSPHGNLLFNDIVRRTKQKGLARNTEYLPYNRVI